MKKIVIMPTINVPTVLTQWATSLRPGVDQIIVAGGGAPHGDGKPHGKIEDLMHAIEDKFGVQSRYLTPEYQMQYSSSKSMGWYTTCRRNIALLEALKEKPDLIVTLDDDNAPVLPDQLFVVESYFENSDEVEGLRTTTGWYDPGERCLAEDGWGNGGLFVTHRGFPLSRRFETYVPELVDPEEAAKYKIGVFASLWTGAPDIDAIERLVMNPTVTSVDHGGVKVLPGTWAPFDSQATYYRAELAPLMMCWPGVGRYDDIWASYLARAVMDHFEYSVYYGHPTVHQDRNPHDFLKDLDAELFGMRHNDTVIDILRSVEFMTSDTISTAMFKCHEALRKWNYLPEITSEAFTNWYRDIVEVIFY